MADIPKERLRHLMSSAIRELWKKETGSRMSVSIDATICITPRNGRTTVIQVSDQFQNSLSEGDHAYIDDTSTNHYEHVNGNQLQTPVRPSGKAFTTNGRPSSASSPIESSPANRCAATTTPVRSSPVYENNNKTLYADQPFFTKLNNNSKKLSKSRVTSEKSSVKKSVENGHQSFGGDRSIQPNLITLQALQYRNNVHAAKDDNNNNETGEFNAEILLHSREEWKDQDIKIETTSDEEDDDDDDSSSDLDLDDSVCLNSTRLPERSRDGSIVHNFSKPLALAARDLRQTNEEVKTRKDRSASSDRDDDQDDSAIQDMSMDLSYSEMNASKDGPRSSSTARNADRHKPRTAVPPKTPSADLMNIGRIVNGKYTKLIFGTDASNQAVVDLSKQLGPRDSDLSISSPHILTNQVRDVIRRRLLATNQPVPSPFSPPLVNGHRVSNTSSLGATKIDFTPPSPVGISPIPTDAYKKVRDSPYSRSLSLNGATPILWSRPIIPPGFVGIKQQDSVQQSCASVDVKFLLPFSAAQMESMSGSASNGILPPHSYMTSSQANNLLALNQIRQAAMARASLGNVLSGMPGGEALQENGAGASPAVDEKQGGQNGNDLDGLSSGGDLQGGDQQSIYRCDYCSKTFLFKSKYHEHLPVHTSARPFQCHLCSRTYKYKYDLRVHLRTHLGIPTKSTVCPFCTDKFGTNKLLRAHIRDMHREQQQIGEKQRAISLEGMMALGSPRTESSTAESGSRSAHGLDNYTSNGGPSIVMDLDLDVGNSEYSTKALDTAVGTPSTSAEDLSVDGSSRSAPDQEMTVDKETVTSHELSPLLPSNGSCELRIDTTVLTNQVSVDVGQPGTVSTAS